MERAIIVTLKNVSTGTVTVYVGATAGTVVGGSGCNLYTYGNYINIPSTVAVLYPAESLTIPFYYDDSKLNPPACGSLTEYGIVKVYADPDLTQCIAGTYAYNTFQFSASPGVNYINFNPWLVHFDYVGQTITGTLYLSFYQGCQGTYVKLQGMQFYTYAPVSINYGYQANQTYYSTNPGTTTTIAIPISINLYGWIDGDYAVTGTLYYTVYDNGQEYSDYIVFGFTVQYFG